MTVSVQFTPGPGDHMRAIGSSLLARKPLSYFVMIFFVVLPWGLALLYTIIGASLNRNFLGIILALILAPFMTVFSFWLMFWLQAKKSQRTVPTLQGIHTYTFNEAGIQITAPGLSNNMKWETVTRIYDCVFGILIFSGVQPMLFIPPHAFLNNQQRIVLQELVNDHLTVSPS